MSKAAGLKRLVLTCQRYIFRLTVDNRIYLWHFFVKFLVAKCRGILRDGDIRKEIIGVKEQSLIFPIVKYLRSNGYVTCTEYRTPWAIPDVLAACLDEEKVNQRLAKGQITPLTRELYWQILKLIPDTEQYSHIDVKTIAQNVGLSPSYLMSKILNTLRRNNYIVIQDGKCAKINGVHPYSKTLVSVEAKVKDWKHAGEQALRHQKFVNQAYVALPSQHIRPALNNLDAFKNANLGLLEVNTQDQIIQHFIPAYQDPVLDTLYNAALDSLWAIVQSERKPRLIKEEATNVNTNSKSVFHT